MDTLEGLLSQDMAVIDEEIFVDLCDGFNPSK